MKPTLIAAFSFAVVGCDFFSESGKTGDSCKRYDRDSFGYGRVDSDGDGCYARAEILISRSLSPVVMDPNSRCRVARGKWADAYSDDTLFNADSVEIDHVVALSEAHKSGAYGWDEARKRQFGNLDTLDEMVITKSSTNGSKSDFDISRWVPPGTERQRLYAEKWLRIKTHWGLSADPGEILAIQRILGSEVTGLPSVALEYDCDN